MEGTIFLEPDAKGLLTTEHIEATLRSHASEIAVLLLPGIQYYTGQLHDIPGITSLATTLGAVKVSARTYELATTRKQVKTFVLSDEEAMMGCWRLAEDERLLVELSCSVTVALCYGGRLEKALGRPVKKDDKVVIVVCGGSNVSLDMVTQWKKDSAHIDTEVTQEEKATVASATVMNGN